eukprot:Hpha_TRINITY_DN11278_c0_g1::TRINITY_DN11278_c0_g1_i1::g.167657::m.167657
MGGGRLSSRRLCYSARPRRGAPSDPEPLPLWPQVRSVRDGLLRWCADHPASSTMAVWVVQDIVENFAGRPGAISYVQRAGERELDWCRAGYSTILEPRRRLMAARGRRLMAAREEEREAISRAPIARCGGWYSLIPILWGFAVERSVIRLNPPPGVSTAMVLKVWRLALGALDIAAERRRACRVFALWWGRRFGGVCSHGSLLRQCIEFLCDPTLRAASNPNLNPYPYPDGSSFRSSRSYHTDSHTPPSVAKRQD